MSTITPTLQDTSLAASDKVTTAPAQTTAKERVQNTMNTFLVMLTKQLQNQDPLSPMDTNQFTQQLIQFNGVEQTVSMNEKLSTMVELLEASNNAETNVAINDKLSSLVNLYKQTQKLSTASLINQEVEYLNIIEYHNTPTAIPYKVPEGIQSPYVKIVNEAGNTLKIFKDLSAQEGSVVWDGRTDQGEKVEPGQYMVMISGQDANKTLVTQKTLKGKVDYISEDQNNLYAHIGNKKIHINNIVGLLREENIPNDVSPTQ